MVLIRLAKLFPHRKFRCLGKHFLVQLTHLRSNTSSHGLQKDIRANTENTIDIAHTNTDPATKYGKRSRHKTKNDRYEVKASTHSARNIDVQKRRRLNKDHVPGNSFHASNVDAKRVTLKPTVKVGIFSRSKTSIPLTGRDLPDLTFASIDFLSNKEKSAHVKMKSVHRASCDDRKIMSKELADFMEKYATGETEHSTAKQTETLDSQHESVLHKSSNSKCYTNMEDSL